MYYIGLRSQPRVAFFGVFDGHSGKLAAEYAKTHLPFNVLRHEKFSIPKPITENGQRAEKPEQPASVGEIVGNPGGSATNTESAANTENAERAEQVEKSENFDNLRSVIAEGYLKTDSDFMTIATKDGLKAGT